MKRTLIVTLGIVALLATSSFADAGDRLERRSGFLGVSNLASVDHDHDDHRGKALNQHRKNKHDKKDYKAWKRDKYERKHANRHHRDKHPYWKRGHNRHEPRVVYRTLPPRTVVRERVVVSPVYPLPFPNHLVFHFSF